jgi:S1-C subfamily serine protease
MLRNFPFQPPSRVSDDSTAHDPSGAPVSGPSDQVSGPSSPASNAELTDAELLDAYSRAVIHVVEAVSPAVISITGHSADEPRGSGSGFVIAPDGFAVTNSHVVGGRSRLTAQTLDGDRVDARVIGDDPATDVALVRLAAGDLPSATIGDSAAVRVGQLVIAMGSPLGLHSTVSTGIASALGRSMRGQDGRLIDNVVQHTAPINPGNSGGPLLDSRGRVIGVNTAIIAMAQGLGFAVPSNTASWVVAELMNHGRVRRRTLGITGGMRRLPRMTVREWDLLSDEVVEVVELLPGGAAMQAGLHAGDLIVGLNDRVVANIDELHRLLAKMGSEKSAELEIVRNGERRRLVVAWPS